MFILIGGSLQETVCTAMNKISNQRKALFSFIVLSRLSRRNNFESSFDANSIYCISYVCETSERKINTGSDSLATARDKRSQNLAKS